MCTLPSPPSSVPLSPTPGPDSAEALPGPGAPGLEHTLGGQLQSQPNRLTSQTPPTSTEKSSRVQLPIGMILCKTGGGHRGLPARRAPQPKQHELGHRGVLWASLVSPQVLKADSLPQPSLKTGTCVAGDPLLCSQTAGSLPDSLVPGQALADSGHNIIALNFNGCTRLVVGPEISLHI